MKFIMDYPVRTGLWSRPESITSFARTVEDLGFDALGFSDHPAPSAKWMQMGGHEAFDPFAAMSFVAGVTERLNVIAHLLVVPYRNPLLQASAIASVDVLSGGRSVFVLGAGYMRSEFAALGVEFDERNRLFDEGVEVMRRFLGGEDLQYEGDGFTAVNQRLRPLPVQRPHPPLWVGGNSAVALDRVASWGSGWSAMIASEQLARSARTRPISSLADLERCIARIRRRAEDLGRDPSGIAICASSPKVGPGSASSRAEQIEEIARLREVGVGYVRVTVEGDFVRALDQVRDFADAVVNDLT